MFREIIRREHSFSLPDTVAFVLTVVVVVTMLVGAVAAARDAGRYAATTRGLPAAAWVGVRARAADTGVALAAHGGASPTVACESIDRAGDVSYRDGSVVAGAQRPCVESRAQ